MFEHITPPDPEVVRSIVRAALEEDRARHDVTTHALVPPDQRGAATVVYREGGIVCGLEVARAAFEELSSACELHALLPDGWSTEPGDEVATVEGPLGAMLSAERVALNLLQRMSGIATLTRRFVEAAAAGGRAQITDTRKTTPGLRELERYAVRVGGGRNHRNSLEDGVLIKDNHIAAAIARGLSIADVVREARRRAPHTLRVEIEVTDPATALLALAAGPDVILLDNMAVEEMRQVVESAGEDVLIEASGGVHLDTVAAVASTGVDLISVGALTHSAPALDIAFEVQAQAQ